MQEKGIRVYAASLGIALIVLSLSGMVYVNGRKGSGSLPPHGVDYWWVHNISKGNYVQLEIQTDSIWDWTSKLYYSNLTLYKNKTEDHNHTYEFYAPETDEFLLRLNAKHGLTLYTVNCTYPVTRQGDINRDFDVDHEDLKLLAKAYGSKVGDMNYDPQADLNADGHIDHEDLKILARNYGKTCM